MISKSTFYYYDGLFLDENMIKKLRIQRNTGMELIFRINDFDHVYILNCDEVKEINKNDLIEILGNNKNKDLGHFYRIVNNNFILLPIKKFYGINGTDGSLFVYYEDQMICEAKFSLVLKQGIQAIADDMVNVRNEISEFNHQNKLKKIYKSFKSPLK